MYEYGGFYMEYILNTPYPSIDKLDVNVTYGQIMLSNLGGLHSEMNTVALYFYNSVILEQLWPDLSIAMKQMSQTEMKHLDIIARMCSRLGVDPRLWDCQNDFLEYWSPGYNVYPRQIHSLLENAIIQEQNTITTHQYQITCINDPLLQKILKRIIMDDQLHIEVFENFLKQHYQQKKHNLSKQFK